MTTPTRPPLLVPPASRARSAGWWVQVVALSHLTVGARLFRDVIGEVSRAGVVGTVPLRGDRATAFWFLLASPVWWALGRELRAAEDRDDRAAQRRTGRAVAGLGATGAAMFPASPFWVLLGLGVVAVRRAGRRGGAPA